MVGYNRYRIRILEVGKANPIVTEYHGCVDENFLVKFYGLDSPDVVDYKIEKI